MSSALLSNSSCYCHVSGFAVSRILSISKHEQAVPKCLFVCFEVLIKYSLRGVPSIFTFRVSGWQLGQMRHFDNEEPRIDVCGADINT